MNQERVSQGAGRTLIGCLLGAVLALASPLVMITELLSLLVVVSVPAIGLVLLYRWAGRVPALLTGVLMLISHSMYLGTPFMWMTLLMSLIPAALLIRAEDRPFGTQMRLSIVVFGAGVLAGVFVLYLSFGGNMIEQIMLELPKALRTLPAESVEVLMQSVSTMLGRTMTLEQFYELFDDTVRGLIPYYQLNLPGLIFSGALISAVVCVGAGNRMRRKRGEGAAESYLPLREWALPSSATGGLLLMLALSFLLESAGMRSAETLRHTVYSIAVTAFCIQAIASMARRAALMPVRHGTRVAMVAVAAILCVMGGGEIIAIYGCLSAIFGSRGAMYQRMERNRSDNDRSGGQ